MEIVNSLVLITLHILISQVYNRISIFSLLSTHVITFNIIINTKSDYILYYIIIFVTMSSISLKRYLCHLKESTCYL